MRYAFLALMIMLSGPALADDAAPAPSPAPAPVAAAAPLPASDITEIPGLVATPINRIAPTAVERRVAFQTALFPDCTVMDGLIVGRIVVAPLHGSIRFTPFDGFPNYKNDSSFAKCNGAKLKGLAVMYQSEDNFVGDESISVLLMLPDGWGLLYNIKIYVR
jgi:hypothetical protein